MTTPLTDPSQDLSCTIGTIEVWFKAFIPRDIPAQTKPLPGSSGKTLLDVPGVPGYFATDQRSYNGDPDAPARMTSLVTIDVKKDRWDERHWCDPTHKVDHETGEVLKSKAGTMNGEFTLLEHVEGPNETRWRFQLEAEGANPLAPPGAPDVDYRGALAVTTTAKGDRARVEFSGMVDEFPAYEMYARIDGGPSHIVLQRTPDAGKSVWNLFGGANVPVSGEAALRKRCGFQIRHHQMFVTAKTGPGAELTMVGSVWPDDTKESGWACEGTVEGWMTMAEIEQDERGDYVIQRTWEIDLHAPLRSVDLLSDVDDLLTYLIRAEAFPPAEGSAAVGSFPDYDENARRTGFVVGMLPFGRDERSGHWEFTTTMGHSVGFGGVEAHQTVDVERVLPPDDDAQSPPPSPPVA